MQIYRLLTLLFLLPSMVLAQQSVPISKAEALEKVKGQNHQLKIGEQEVLSAQGDYRQTNAVFLPNIRASHTGMGTTNPLMAFGFRLNQEIVTQADFDPNSLNNPSQINLFATKFEIEQPILNLDGIYQRKAAKAKWDATQLQVDRTEEHTSELQSRGHLVCRLLLEKKKKMKNQVHTNKPYAQPTYTSARAT